MAKKSFRLWKPGESPEAWDDMSFLDMLSDEEIQKAVKQVVKNYEMSRDWRTPYRDKWLRMYMLMRGYSPFYEDKSDWQANYFVQKGFEFVETVHPRIVSSLYDVPPLWAAIPFEQGMAESAKLTELLLQRRVEQTEMYMVHSDAIKEMLMYGTSFMKGGYAIEPGYEGTKWYNADLFDMYPDPYHKKIEDMKYLIERSVKHNDEIEYYEDMGLYRGAKQYIKDNQDGGRNNYFNSMDREKAIGLTGGNSQDMKEYHEILEQWGKYRVGEDMYDVVMVVIDRKEMLRFDVNPYYFENKVDGLWYAEKPYVKMINVSMPHEVYGVGELEVIEGAILELNDRRNMYMDGLQYMMSPVFQVMRNLLVNPNQEIVFAPGEFVEVEGVGGIDPVKPIQMHSGFLHGMTDVEQIKQEMRDALGIHHAITGAEGNIRQTATEKVLNLQEANQRIKSKIQINDIVALRKQARMTYLMERQFTDEDVLATVFDNGRVRAWAKINPSQLEFEGDFKLQVASLYGLKGMRAQQLMQFMEILQSINPQDRPNVSMEKLVYLIGNQLDIAEEDIRVEADPAGQMLPPMQGGQPALSLIQGGAPPMAGMPQTGPGMPQSEPQPSDLINQLLAAVAPQGAV